MRRRWLALGLGLTLGLSGSPLLAQSDSYAQEGFEQLPPTAAREAEPPPPALVFERVARVDLDGPLFGTAPRWLEGRVLVHVAAGLLAVELAAEPSVSDWNEAPASTSDPRRWVESPSGKRRFRTGSAGKLVAERRCRRCRDGWKRIWKLRIPGSTPAAPLVLEKQVCIGTLGNQIYCVKPRSGYRLWTGDLDDRLSGELVGLPAPGDDPDAWIILSLPDRGRELIAYDAAGGNELARLPFGEQERLVGGVLVAPDGRVVVTRQGYSAGDAQLLAYRLRIVEAQEEPVATDVSPPPAAAGPR